LSRVIRVSDYVYERLMEIKNRNGHTSLDSVIRYLLMKAGEECREGS